MVAVDLAPSARAGDAAKRVAAAVEAAMVEKTSRLSTFRAELEREAGAKAGLNAEAAAKRVIKMANFIVVGSATGGGGILNVWS